MSNHFFAKITQLLFQGDELEETASNQCSGRDANRVLFCLSADTPEFRRPWAVSGPSGAVAADALKAPRIARADHCCEETNSTPQECGNPHRVKDGCFVIRSAR